MTQIKTKKKSATKNKVVVKILQKPTLDPK